MNDNSTAVRLDACGKTFPDGTQALKSITLDVAAGETVVLLGPSGCGKTTVLRVIAGLEQPDRGGRVLFNGADVTAVPIEQRNVGMVFQSAALFPNMNVADNIGYGLKVRGMPERDRRARVTDLMALTGIEGLGHRRISQLSGGELQRVALARALAVRPRVLLLDEPLTALDAQLRERLREYLGRLLRSLGNTNVYVTHDQSEAMALGDRIVVMRSGTIAQIGTPREIYFEPASRFVAEFVGAANILSGRVADRHLQLPGGRVPLERVSDGTVTVMVRPEAIAVVPEKDAALRGRVDTVSFVGDRLRLGIIEATEHALMIDAPNTLRLRIGDPVGLAIAPGAARILPGD